MNKEQNQQFNTDSYITYLRQLHQEGPHLGNQYLEDSALQSYIRQFLPEDVKKFAETEQNRGLIELGEKVVGEIKEAGEDAEANPPYLQATDAFGKKIDKVVLSYGWRQQRYYSAYHHIVGSAYCNHPQLGKYQRFLQSIRMYLYHPSSGLFGCPLAMTDGCAYVLKSIMDSEKNINPYVRKKIENIYSHLVSNDPKQFWTSGQWMTEKRGGTDVGNTTETVAIQYKENKYKLYGFKFFCSAADCDVSLALARIIDPSRQYTQEEIRKLPISLFILKLRRKDGSHNGLEYQALKQKLGTKQLPTAEMILNGTKALLISPQGRGIKYIVHMLQITRLYNASTSVSIMRRFIALCRDYSDRRSVFGKQLQHLPMHIKLLNDMEITFRGNLLFYLKVSDLFGKVQENIATKIESDLARLGSPLLKLFTAKELQQISSESLEIFGGLGYCENSKLPVLYRDGQVLPIWEGTTNVLSHDFHRALMQKDNPINSFSIYISNILMDNVSSESKITEQSRVKEAIKLCILSYNELMSDIQELIRDKIKYKKYYEFFMRDICLGTSRIWCAVLLLDQYLKSGEALDLEVFLRWVAIKPLYNPDKKMNLLLNSDIAMDRQINGQLRGNGQTDFRGMIRPKF